MPRHPLLLLPLLLGLASQATSEEDRPAADAPWKVEDQHAPSDMIGFTTSEGTWLASDIHPDGSRMVFSLLGDLYVLPLGGGKANRITFGPGYDVQPRFSPDGKTIAFASDRGGLEGLWVCDLEGKNPRPITSDPKSQITSPAWSEDGQWLVGSKRSTDTSSIGVVELWMYHLLGGGGIQLTKGDEIGHATDPVVSRDGRFIYFSGRDGRYKYDSDVNDGIWQIKRFDRHTGKTVNLTSLFGGAATPQLSPDGKQLAYVRRVRGTTRLEVLNLTSGATRVVAEGLTRDNQEGFASHGVFPGYGWTPDGASIVATAEGKFWRYDALSGVRSAIPFEVQVDQRVAKAVRFPQTLGTDTLQAKIIRWPVESPDGKRLVFSALGHLYVMDLPAGQPRRLTTTSDFEYAPAFSADGKQLTFTTWNDDTGGHVWVMPSTGGAPRKLTTTPGQYVNPAFSPDGTKVVFARGSGSWFRDGGLADELWLELMWMPVKGGEPQLITSTENRGSARRVTRPAFSKDGTRIYYFEDEAPEKPRMPPKTALVSVKLDGTDRRVPLRFEGAGEVTVSPDEKWVVYNERHNVWVTALPEAGKDTVAVGMGESPLPIGQLSDEGGEWVRFAENGKTVTWSFGPRYFRIPLDQAVPVPKDEPEPKKDEKPPKKALPTPQTVEINLTAPRLKGTGVIAYTGARIVTMKGQEVIEKGTLVVDGNRILKVGGVDQVQIPAGAKVVDLAGKTIIPGMIDVHAHLHYGNLDVLPQHSWQHRANLAYGITTVHDPSASSHEAFGMGELIEGGLSEGPRVYSTGYILYGADDPDGAHFENLDDARHHIRRLKGLGAISVKSYMQARRDHRQWVLQAAREEGMMVVPEGGGDLEMNMSMVLDGHSTIEHALPMTPLYQDVVQLFARSGTTYTPTLLVAYGGISGENWFYQHYEVWNDPRLQRYTPQGVLDSRARVRDIMATDADWHHINVAASAKKILDAGGTINLGGHGQLQGLGPHWEIWAYVQGGMSPLQALGVATIGPAHTLGMDKDLGSLEAGKLADFVVMDKNPLEHIENTDSVSMVVKNGISYDTSTLTRKPHSL